MKVTKKLTQKQEAACKAYIECGCNQSEAYRQAYNCVNQKPETVWVNASKLFSNTKVMQRVLELQAMHAKRHNVTVDSITDELDENRELAREANQPAAMTAATMGKAKIHGLLTDKIKIEQMSIEEIEALSDEELEALKNGFRN